MNENCQQWREQMTAYADRELSPDQVSAFLAHARECPNCACDALAAVAAKDAVRKAGVRYAAPSELRARVAAAMAQSRAGLADISASADAPALFPPAWAHRQQTTSPPDLRAPWWRGQFALVAAAAVLLVVGLVVSLKIDSGREQQALVEFADLHVATLASASPVDVVSTDKHTVKPWFQGRIPFAFEIPELKDSPFTLVGGRVSYFHQEPAAQLIVGYQKHMISVFVLRDSPQLAVHTASLTERSSGFNIRSWTQNGLRYVVLGDVNPGAVQQLSELLQHAN